MKNEQNNNNVKKLIEKEFKEYEFIPKITKVFNEQPTYYQLISFINILYLYLIKFSKNNLFKIEQLFDESDFKDGKDKTKIEFKIRG